MLECIEIYGQKGPKSFNAYETKLWVATINIKHQISKALNSFNDEKDELIQKIIQYRLNKNDSLLSSKLAIYGKYLLIKEPNSDSILK